MANGTVKIQSDCGGISIALMKSNWNNQYHSLKAECCFCGKLAVSKYHYKFKGEITVSPSALCMEHVSLFSKFAGKIVKL